MTRQSFSQHHNLYHFVIVFFQISVYIHYCSYWTLLYHLVFLLLLFPIYPHVRFCLSSSSLLVLFFYLYRSFPPFFAFFFVGQLFIYIFSLFLFAPFSLWALLVLRAFLLSFFIDFFVSFSSVIFLSSRVSFSPSSYYYSNCPRFLLFIVLHFLFHHILLFPFSYFFHFSFFPSSYFFHLLRCLLL